MTYHNKRACRDITIPLVSHNGKRDENDSYSQLFLSCSTVSITVGYNLHHFQILCSVFEPPVASVQLFTFRTILQHAVRQSFGTVAEAAIVLDVIRYDPTTATAILHTLDSDHSTLWCALAMFSQYERRKCYFYIHAASPFLIALTAPRNPLRWNRLQLGWDG
ncbi:ribonuclease P [Galdieria sulphuraria]|uniref:Ribonuclease P n=1 Tax=Galdieria sulphuraria TaxID=130081 RepID=M2VTB1_GALSU|nr:ribonuclease P [Galdieria sulphuraria]EME26421.1 ribonuclease P [Galdieria sulphuraria]|eukprot:XP_005702941.1 ribonuclease P [Galdieria sulphuraria]